MIFAAAPSQNEFLASLVRFPGIAWDRVNAFHMDEYVGLPVRAPQGFGNFLRERLFGKVPFKAVYYLDGNSGDLKSECYRYSTLLRKNPVDIVCMGIGENGHIAFNDPHSTRFNDLEQVKLVSLDSQCRTQQVHDGCFEQLADVPTHALTLTVPALMRAEFVYCVVPGNTKEPAVYRTVREVVSESCPASVLRTCPNAVLYTDADSGKRLILRKSVITDEISQDFGEAATLAAESGLEAVEIRSVWEKGPHELDDVDINKIRAILARYGLNVSAISAPVFKCNMDDPGEIEEHFGILKRCVRLAKALDARYIRGFTFWVKRDFEAALPGIISILKRAVPILERENIIMVLETEPSVYAGDARTLVQVLRGVDSPWIRALWDPGNDIFDPGGEIPYPNGYRTIRPYMVHMHLKDARLNEEGKPECVAVGEGAVGFEAHFKELLADGYDGYVSLETHYRKKRALDEALQRRPGGSAFSDGAREATEECLIGWEKIINRIVKGSMAE
jgi:glucosamine-6-phosphate deaminase